MRLLVPQRKYEMRTGEVSKLWQSSKLTAWARRLTLWLVGLNRYPKRAILAVNDFILFNLALWLAMSLRLGELFLPWNWEIFLVLAAAPVIGIATFFHMRVYRMVTRFIGVRGAMLTAGAVGLSGLYWALVVYFSGVYSVPRSVVILYPILATAIDLDQPPDGGLVPCRCRHRASHARAGPGEGGTDLRGGHYGRATPGRAAIHRGLPARGVHRSKPHADGPVRRGPQSVSARANARPCAALRR